MSEERVREIVRQFPENGMKQVLSSPGNLRDLLTLAQATMLPRLDLEALQVEPTTFITAEYRHVSSDLVLNVPLLPQTKGSGKKRLTLTVLVELQSEPDRLMPLRVLDYVVQIFKGQVKRHGQTHRSLASVKLRPVLPVVFHTGSFRWEGLGSLLDLMDDAADFQEVTPFFQPLFVSLPDVSETDLQGRGGYFGQVLALLKLSKASRAAFAGRLAQTVTKLQELKGQQHLRRLELLSYVEGLVYHSRPASEHQALRQRIDASLDDDEARLEVSMVRRTMADVHRDEIALATNKRTLVDLLRLRWGPLSPEVEQAIELTQDANLLSQWLRGVVTARDLTGVGILPPR